MVVRGRVSRHARWQTLWPWRRWHHLTPAQPELLKVGGQNSSFVFKPHQVVGAGTLVQLCKTPIHGGLLANETGTGKTATYLLTLVMQQLEKERVHATGTPVVFKPAMLVVPAATAALAAWMRLSCRDPLLKGDIRLSTLLPDWLVMGSPVFAIGVVIKDFQQGRNQ